LPENALKVLDEPSLANIRFAIGIACSLSLPALIGLDIYIATSALPKAV
jgi:hypothetical protein